ncbi:MAG: zinc-ribbon domain-containing protein [Clostridia bacterium]|nr:zinc-ribbon domain-containing protein [Clostridia bacterium]
MFCSECGHQNRNDRKFCSECGSKLQDYTKPVENVVMPEDIKKAKDVVNQRNKVSKVCNIIIWVFFALSILLLVPILFVKCNNLKIVFACSACVCFVGMIATFVVKKALLMKINKAE